MPDRSPERIIAIPRLALVLLVGPSGCGKSTFAGRHFLPTEVVSSDALRGMIADDEADQTASGAAFDVLHLIVEKRLQRAHFTVVDATMLTPAARLPLARIARRCHVPLVAVVLAPSLAECVANDAGRARVVGREVIGRQHALVEDAIRALQREDVRDVHVLRSRAEVDAARVERMAMPSDRTWDTGPFDIVGDVHGCVTELDALLRRMGWTLDGDTWRHPAGRRLAFLGDLVDRGPDSPRVLRWAMRSVAAGTAICVPGNHDDKLRRKLQGASVKVAHGLERTLEQLAAEPPGFADEVAAFIGTLPHHLILDGARLCIAHAGMKHALQGRDDARVRDFALYGDTTGEVDEFGLPVRLNWAAEYHGRRTVVYGHTPQPIPEWVNETINIDTGCAFGGALTALRWPERELVREPARERYAIPARPFLA